MGVIIVSTTVLVRRGAGLRSLCWNIKHLAFISGSAQQRFVFHSGLCSVSPGRGDVLTAVPQRQRLRLCLDQGFSTSALGHLRMSTSLLSGAILSTAGM